MNIDHLKKPSKKEALEMVLYIKSLEAHDTVDRERLDKLVRYFSPSILQRKPKNIMEWVAKGTADSKDPRY
jgi:hypothetical protein